MKKNKNDIKSKMLSDEQAKVVKLMIVDSMKGVWIDSGALPGDAFINAAANVAERIVQNVQMSLLQSSVFNKAVKNSRPIRKVKKISKVIVKVKKHARK